MTSTAHADDHASEVHSKFIRAAMQPDLSEDVRIARQHIARCLICQHRLDRVAQALSREGVLLSDHAAPTVAASAPGKPSVLDELPAELERCDLWPLMFDWVAASQSKCDEGVLALQLARSLETRRPPTQRSWEEQFARYVSTRRHSLELTRCGVAQLAGVHPLSVALAEVGGLTPAELSEALVSRLSLVLGGALPVPGRDTIRQHSSPGGLLRRAVLQRDATPVAGEPRETGLASPVLLQSLALPVLVLSSRDAAPLRALLTVAQPAGATDGSVELKVRVFGADAVPASFVSVALDLAGRVFVSVTPTNDAGITRIVGIPLADLMQVDTLDIRQVA